jgi:hypothetical protein
LCRLGGILRHTPARRAEQALSDPLLAKPGETAAGEGRTVETKRSAARTSCGPTSMAAGVPGKSPPRLRSRTSARASR